MRSNSAVAVQVDEAAVESLLAACDENAVVLVRFLYCDTGGLIRGKSVSRQALRSALRSGVGLTVAMAAMNPFDQLQVVDGMGPVGEVRLWPDLSTFHVLPYAPHQAALFCDLYDLNGQPWEACARNFLRRAIARGEAAGWRFEAAFENEFTLAVTDTSGSFHPFDETVCFSSIAMQAVGNLPVALLQALEAQGVSMQQYYPELSAGQHEISVRHAPVLQAADNQLRARETIRAIAQQAGFHASLAPKPFANLAGNGAHVHISGWSLDAPGQNRFYDVADRFGLSQEAYHFIGGILAHLPAVVALTCPTVNSYLRLAPQTWASAYRCFGPDNREAAVRIASGFWGDPQGSANVEIKTVDNSCNPYLALGAILTAGLDGIKKGIEPGDPLSVDPATLSEAERQQRRIDPLPRSLDEALAALAGDALLREAMGPMLFSAFEAVKRSESAFFVDVDHDDTRAYFSLF
ncbi:MAG: glutamine synthetase [Firmicutes bacterium]|nr:glutamine synthetase [Bacillota bacterium]